MSLAIWPAVMKCLGMPKPQALYDVVARVHALTGPRYLPQEPQLKEHLSALEAVLQSDSALARCVRAYEAALQGTDEQACPCA